MRLAGIVEESVVDGPGIRLVYFMQGCKHNCRGCHNPQTHNPDGGSEYVIEDLKNAYLNNTLCDGVTFSGGDPMLQADELLPLIKWFAERHVHIIMYTGFTYEEIISTGSESQREILHYIDWLIDGRYVDTLRSMSVKYRGSSNQRIILTKETEKSGKLNLLDT